MRGASEREESAKRVSNKFSYRFLHTLTRTYSHTLVPSYAHMPNEARIQAQAPLLCEPMRVSVCVYVCKCVCVYTTTITNSSSSFSIDTLLAALLAPLSLWPLLLLLLLLLLNDFSSDLVAYAGVRCVSVPVCVCVCV